MDDARLSKFYFVGWQCAGHPGCPRYLLGDGMATTTIYFAYGSNMAASRMLKVCPAGRMLGVGYVLDHQLRFSRRSIRTGGGVADIVPASNREVWGVLYELTHDDLAALDRKEGNGWAYIRTPVVVRRMPQRDELGAVTYTVLHKEHLEICPSVSYLADLVRSAEEVGLPAGYIAMLRSAAPEAYDVATASADTAKRRGCLGS